MSNSPLDTIGQIVGSAHIDGPGSDALRNASARYGLVANAHLNLIGIARPANAQELSSLVRQTHERKLAVLTLYNRSDVGASLSGEGDCLVLDLSRMNRVLEVNPDYAFARVEPSVSFADLARYLDERNLPLMVDAERDPDASVAGSIFSKGMGFTPYADHALVQCGAEFVLPDGGMLRTGMGAMPENRTWQIYKFSLGPFSDGIAMQSAGMIPTQVGIWLMGRPPAIQAFAFDVEDDDGLAAVLEFMRPLKLNNTLAGAIAITHREFDAARTTVTSGRGEWRVFGALYGIPAAVAIIAPMIDTGLGQIEGCRKLAPDALANDPVWLEQLSLMSGATGSAAPRFGGSRDQASSRLTFVAPIEGEAATAMLETSRRALKAHKLPFLTEMALCGRSLFQTIYLPCEPGQAAGDKANANCARQLITDMGEAGYGLVSESVKLSRLATAVLGDSPLHQLQTRIMGAVA